MNSLINGFLLFCLLSLSACKTTNKSSLSPSIEALKANEVLIMDYNSCHWGCNTGVIEFRDKAASFDGRHLKLTEQEIGDLDKYFSLGRSPEEGLLCPSNIEISFELRKSSEVINSKATQFYPCGFGEGNRVTPGGILHYLQKTPSEVPSWRLAPKYRQESLKIED